MPFDIRLPGIPQGYSGSLSYEDDFCQLTPIRGNNSWNSDTIGLVADIKVLPVRILGGRQFHDDVMATADASRRFRLINYMLAHLMENHHVLFEFIEYVKCENAASAQDDLRAKYRELLGI